MTGSAGNGKRRIRFEFTPLGLLGVVAVCLAALAWMVMLGVWAGQTVLLPSEPAVVETLHVPVEQDLQGAKTPPASAPAGQEEMEPAERELEVTSPTSVTDATFFALQIGAFSTQERAERFAREWQGKGLATFYQEPAGGGDRFWRVFAGHHQNLESANAQAASLRKEENLKSFVALVRESEIRQP